MKKVLLFDGDFDYNHFTKMSNSELYTIAKSKEVYERDAVRIMDLDEFQSYWNGTPEELHIKSTWLFFADVEKFSVWVPDVNIDKFSEDYAPYIEDSVVTHHDMHVCSLTAPKEVKEEIKGLREDGIIIV